MHRSERISLSVVLPAYNEEAVIERVVGRVVSYLRAKDIPCEVLVVDDGSTDRTGERVQALRQRYPEVRLLTHARNRGYGEALRSGFGEARNAWVLLMDADGQFDIGSCDAFLVRVEEADMIIGFRANRADPFFRAAFTFLYTKVVSVLFGLPFRDPGCAFKLFRRSAWHAAQPVRSTDHKVFTVEWLLNARRAGLTIVECPVSHHPRTSGRSTGARPDVIWKTLAALLDLRRRVS